MSFSNRLHNAAVRGCLTALLTFVVLGLSPRHDPSWNTGDQAQAEQQQAPSPAPEGDPFKLGKKGESSTYRAICDQPKDKEQADLCQQWRSAEAAERGATLNRLQVWIGAFGLVAIGLSLLLSGAAVWLAAKSTKQAARAAAAADRTAGIMEDTAARQLRAYVQIDDTKGPDLTSGPPYLFEFFIKNGGQTPAYAVRQWTGFTLGPHPLNQELPPPKVAPRYSAVIGGQGRVKVMGEIDQYTPDEVMRIKGDDVRLYVFGVITYRDIFDKEWETPFRMMYGGREARHSRGMLFSEEGNDPKQSDKRPT